MPAIGPTPSRSNPPRVAQPDTQPLHLSSVETASFPPGAGSDELSELFDDRLRHGRALAAAELVRDAGSARSPCHGNSSIGLRSRTFTSASRLKHGGTGSEHTPPSPALRLTRIAQAELALTDVEPPKSRSTRPWNSTIVSARRGSGSPCSNYTRVMPTQH